MIDIRYVLFLLAGVLARVKTLLSPLALLALAVTTGVAAAVLLHAVLTLLLELTPK